MNQHLSDPVVSPPLKARCLQSLSQLFGSVGNNAGRRRLLTHVLKLWRDKGDDRRVALTLVELSDVNRLVDLHKEGIQLAKETLEIFERLGDTAKQAEALISLAHVLFDDHQLDAASRAIGLLLEKGEQFQVCQGRRVLGNISQSKGDTEKAIHHYEVALGIASSFNWHDELFWVHYALSKLSFRQGRFDGVQAHIERGQRRIPSGSCDGAASSPLV